MRLKYSVSEERRETSHVRHSPECKQITVNSHCWHSRHSKQIGTYIGIFIHLYCFNSEFSTFCCHLYLDYKRCVWTIFVDVNTHQHPGDMSIRYQTRDQHPLPLPIPSTGNSHAPVWDLYQTYLSFDNLLLNTLSLWQTVPTSRGPSHPSNSNQQNKSESLLAGKAWPTSEL